MTSIWLRRLTVEPLWEEAQLGHPCGSTSQAKYLWVPLGTHYIAFDRVIPAVVSGSFCVNSVSSVTSKCIRPYERNQAFSLLSSPLRRHLIRSTTSSSVAWSLSQMGLLDTTRVPATRGGGSCLPMSQPCLLCLPMHSSCDQNTCPSLILCRQEPPKKAEVPVGVEYWIMSTTMVALDESASKGCAVCATLYTGLMTRPSCQKHKNVVQVTIAHGGHVVTRPSDVSEWEELIFYSVKGSGKT